MIASTIRDRSITLFKWQSFLDNKRMLYVSNNLGEYLANEIRLKHCPIRIVIHGRKQTTQDFYTFIGGDAIAALTEYFEKERGWPKKAEAVWLSKHNRPIVEIDQNYRKLLRRMGVIPEKPKGKPGVDRKSTSTGVRYGYSQHEFRDVAKTLLHVKAKREGLDMDSMKFFMGHLNQLDPNRYDTFYHDIPYMEEQYKIAEPYLNIISQPPGSHETNAQLAKLQEQATKDREEATARLKALEAHVKWLELIRQGKLHPDMTPICPHCEEEQYKVGHTIQYEWDFDGENFKCLRCGGTEWEPSQPVTDREYREIMKRPKKPRAKIKKPKQKKR